jgi:hypothetical protein
MKRSQLSFNDNEPGIYRQRGILEIRILEEGLTTDQLKNYLKNLAQILGMHVTSEQPDPIIASSSDLKYTCVQASLFCVEAGLHLGYWQEPQFMTLDIHSRIVIDEDRIKQVTQESFDLIEYSYLELVPQNIKKDNQKIELKINHELGRAIFAKENIVQGEFIGGLYGDIHKASDSSNLPEGVADHALQFAQNKWRLSHLGGLVQYENHACKANVGMRGLFDLVALREIKAGEEIVADYATMEDSDWQFPGGKCLCKLPNCRQKFLPFRLLLPEDQKKIWDYTSPWIRKKYMRTGS